MEQPVKTNTTGQTLIIIAFVLACLGLAALSIFYALPDSLVLIMAAVLVWMAVRRSMRTSLVLFGVMALSIGATMFLSTTQPWWDGAIALGIVSSMYAVSLLIVRNIQRQHRLYVDESLRLEAEASLNHRVVAMYAPHFEFWVKPDGHFAYVSPACKRVIGWTPVELTQNPQRLFDSIRMEDRSRVLFELTREKKKNEEGHPFEFLLLRVDGQQRWIEMICQQAYDDQGEYLGKRGTAEDITEQKQIEQNAIARVDHLTMALEGANEGLWDFDLANGRATFNASYARLLGLPEGRTSIPMQEYYNRVHTEDMPQLIAALRSHVMGKTSIYEAEYRLNVNNNWRWVLDRGRVAERDVSGKAARLVGVHIDISERKNIEGALKQSEMKFRQVAENMREVFWLRDRNSRKFIYISPAFSEIWGQSAEALYDNPNIFIESIHPEDLSRVFTSQKELLDNGRDLQEEFRVIHPSGKIHWVWSRAYPIYNEAGQYYRIAGFLENVTERKLSDLSLQESEKRYRDLIEQQGGGVGIFDPNDKIIYVNPAGEEIFGVSHGTLAGRNIKEFLSDDQLNVLMGQTALRRQGVESSYELLVTRPDGDIRSLLFTATPRFDANNQFLGNIVIFRDISQRRLKEERLLYVSQHDTLTGLYNRGVFEDEINRLDQSIQWPVGVIMIDADGLKIVNDQMGHARGDELLIRISGILKLSVRDSDIVSRLGGDEFGILLPQADDHALQHVMDRIFETIAEENRKMDNPFTISVSAGGMVCNQKGGLKDAMKEADARMYQAKNQKKNQFYLDLPIIGRKKL
jgi:diguanylate cyclase (GGDEF)-like protein/PAS domain S-box-containing protein